MGKKKSLCDPCELNSAIQVDLTGQVNADIVGELQVSGVRGQTDFVCGAALSKKWKSIITLSSASKRKNRK